VTVSWRSRRPSRRRRPCCHRLSAAARHQNPMLTMVACPACRRNGAAAFTHRNVPVRFTEMVWCQSRARPPPLAGTPPKESAVSPRTIGGWIAALSFTIATQGNNAVISAWCPGAESNHRHCDFQSHALPTELPGHPGWSACPREAWRSGSPYNMPPGRSSRLGAI
jgi:hypothetical protein